MGRSISENGYLSKNKNCSLSAKERRLLVFCKYMEYIKRRILKEMQKKDLNQIDISLRAGVSQSTINRILNTGVSARIGTLNKIAHVLGVPVEYLVTEDETKALLFLEISHLSKEEIHQTLLHLEKEKLYKESKKAI